MMLARLVAILFWTPDHVAFGTPSGPGRFTDAAAADRLAVCDNEDLRRRMLGTLLNRGLFDINVFIWQACGFWLALLWKTAISQFLHGNVPL